MVTAATARPVVRLRRHARLLVWATIAWNAIEAVVALAAGSFSHSSALVGFGLDAVIEASAALAALWYLHGAGETRAKAASRLIGVSFWLLATWVAVDATVALVHQHRPDVSVAGMAITAASLVVMPLLAFAKRRTAAALNSHPLASEAKQTAVCAYLSVAVLAGLVLNATLSWWWADPLAALVIAVVAAREGIEAWRGDLLDDGGCC